MRDAMRLRPEGWCTGRIAIGGPRDRAARGESVRRRRARTARRARAVRHRRIGRWVETGRLAPPAPPRGLRLSGHALVPTRGRWLAAVLACGPAAALSHASAAALWGLRRSEAVLIDVTLPGTGRGAARACASIARATSPRKTSRRSTAFASRARRGRSSTSRRRWTLARSSGSSTSAERERVYDGRALAAVMAANRCHRGAARLRAILAEHVAGTTVTRSGLEEQMLALCRAHGLPRPVVNHLVLDLEVDFVFPGTRVLVEAAAALSPQPGPVRP